MDIKKLKQYEIQEMIDFYCHLEEYGHIFHLDPKLLERPFEKIMEGISEVRKMIEESYEI